MSEPSSVVLRRCLERMKSGDDDARNDLFTFAGDRLRRLTRAMLRDYPGVHRWEETADVYQNALLRLCRALRDVVPTDARDFYRLAALQVRRELIDLARHYYGPQGGGARHDSQPPNADGRAAPPYEPPDLSHDPARLALWTEFHRQVEALPDEEREVFDLLWYQGLKQEEAAEVAGVTTRTIKTRWRSARLMLHEALDGQLPGT